MPEEGPHVTGVDRSRGTSILGAELPGPLVWLLALAAMALVGLLDFATGNEINFSIFYLVPVLIMVWYASVVEAMAVALIAALLWMQLDLVSGSTYSSPLIPWWNALVRLGFFLIALFLLAEVRRSHDREAVLSRTDALTGIANSRYFDERARLEIADLRRNRIPLTVAFIDLDDFKAINDTYGHAEGDRVLKAVAAALRERARETDVVARLGGDEFCLLLPGTGVDAASAALADLRIRAEQSGGKVPVSLTIGSMTFEDPPVSVDEFISLADTLMYQGKAEGKGRTLVGVWRDPKRVGG